MEKLTEEQMTEAELVYMDAAKPNDYNSLNKDQKYYLAMKYGAYDLIRFEKYDFNNLKKIIRKYPNDITKLLPHCETKQEQKELVKMAFELNFKNLYPFLSKKYPQLTYEYITEELEVERVRDNRINYKIKDTQEKVTIMRNDIKNNMTLADKIENKDAKNKPFHITRDIQLDLIR